MYVLPFFFIFYVALYLYEFILNKYFSCTFSPILLLLLLNSEDKRIHLCHSSTYFLLLGLLNAFSNTQHILVAKLSMLRALDSESSSLGFECHWVQQTLMMIDDRHCAKPDSIYPHSQGWRNLKNVYLSTDNWL